MLMRRRPGMGLEELFNLFDGGFPASWKLGTGTQPIRVEDFLEKDRYVIRAELPGIDPDKDVEVSVNDGILTIVAERREETRDRKRSEFHYGSFSRSVTLPAGAKEDEITATFDKGMLEVTVMLETSTEEVKGRTIPVQHS